MKLTTLVPVEPETIQQTIRESDFFIACLSENSVFKRSFFDTEIQEALTIWANERRNNIYLIPLRLDDCKVPSELQDLHWINLFERDGWVRLIQAIQSGLDAQEEGKQIHEKQATIVSSRVSLKTSKSKKQQKRRVLHNQYNEFRKWEKIGGMVCGVIFIGILLSIEYFLLELTEFQHFLLQVVLALAAAGFGAMFPGFFNFNANLMRSAYLRVGGVFILFVIVYWLNPLQLVMQNFSTLKEQQERVIVGRSIDGAKKYHKREVFYVE